MKKAAQNWWDEVKLMAKPTTTFTTELMNSVRPKMIGHFTQVLFYFWQKKYLNYVIC